MSAAVQFRAKKNPMAMDQLKRTPKIATDEYRKVSFADEEEGTKREENEHKRDRRPKQEGEFRFRHVQIIGYILSAV